MKLNRLPSGCIVKVSSDITEFRITLDVSSRKAQSPLSDVKLFAIYDADGSLFGELAYLWRKCTGRAECSLCDLSHGWNPLGRRGWRQRKGATASVSWIHRDELPSHVSTQIIGQLPCVVIDRNDQIEVLISSKALQACDGDFDAFERLLSQKLRALNHKPTPATQSQT